MTRFRDIEGIIPWLAVSVVVPAVAAEGVDDETVGERRECAQQSFGD